MIGVQKRRAWLLALGLSLAAVLSTLLPYVLAVRLAHPAVFGGFLINPTDGYSYLAKMRQGWQGSWLFQLPYTAEPGEGAFIFVYHLFLGQLARMFQLPLLSVYHAARLCASLAMYLLAFVFFKQVLPDRRSHWIAYLLTLFGSGLGWMGLFFGLTPSDLTIPESIPFLTAYTNAHFPLAAAAVLGIAICALRPGRALPRALGAFFGAAVLAAVLPFSALGMAVVFVAWPIWEILRAARQGFNSWKGDLASPLAPVLGFFLGVAPWGAYDLWVQSQHPALRAWTAQNITPSPPPTHYLLGFGLVLALAVAGAAFARPHKTTSGRFLLTWVVATGLMLYAPFPLQRRLSLGVFFPLAGLAALGFRSLFGRTRRSRTALIILLLLSLPSNILVVTTGVASIEQKQPLMVLSRSELAAYHWVRNNLPEDALVLAAPQSGNRLPAFAAVRVLVGHPFETPHVEAQREIVRELYASEQSIQGVQERLDRLGVDAVFYGPRERELGEAGWLMSLSPAFDEGHVRIYWLAGSP
jgi:hypothetical protein